ncbi:MAG: class I SAM-dependent DNA methyltransferase, partial [bacterium]|nr:class I SAM-dependent DNA methyltransferase [bacterium]
MNPEQSHKLVKQTFQADFDRQRFVEFIDRLLKRVDFKKQFKQSGLNIVRAFIDKVNSFERVGQYTDVDGKKIDILIVNLKNDATLERGRTGLRNFAAHYLQSDRGAGKSAVLIAYVSSTKTDWRFSYVTLEKDLLQDDKGKFKEEVTKLTPARRYSFLVGKNENSHTAQRQFFELLNNPAPKLQNVEDAFNIEKVTKEFFADYKL